MECEKAQGFAWFSFGLAWFNCVVMWKNAHSPCSAFPFFDMWQLRREVEGEEDKEKDTGEKKAEEEAARHGEYFVVFSGIQLTL